MFFWCSFRPLCSFLSDSRGFLISFRRSELYDVLSETEFYRIYKKKCSDFMKFDEIVSPLNANQYGVSSETTKY